MDSIEMKYANKYMPSILIALSFLFFAEYSSAKDIKIQAYESCSRGPSELDIKKIRLATEILADLDSRFILGIITRDELVNKRKKFFDDYEDYEFESAKKYNETFGKNDDTSMRLYLDFIRVVRSGTAFKLSIDLKDEKNLTPSDLHISRRFVEICRARVHSSLP